MSRVLQQPYPNYKDSGSEWFDRVPTNWTLSAKIKQLSSLKGRLGWQGLKADEYKEEGPYVVSSAHFSNHSIQWDKCPCVSDDRYEIDSNIQLAENDILLMKDGAALGKLAFVDKLPRRACLNSHLLLFRPLRDQKKPYYFPRYFFYLLTTENFQGYLRVTGTGATFLGVSQQTIGDFKTILPSYPEQQKIADFLDYETAKIDRLIEKQQQLIELLKEKRQAVISHAVTKGLNPNVPLNPSGVEWLGDVPHHWEVKLLRHLGYCQNGLNIGAEAFGSGFPFVSYGDVYNNRVLPKCGSGLVQSSTSDRDLYSVQRGDVFFTRTSETIEEIGFSSTCLDEIQDATFAGFLIRFRPTSPEIDADFSKHYFSNSLLRAFFIKEMNLVTRASLSQELLKCLPVVLPPISEQRKIAGFLDNKIAKFGELIRNANSAIELMQERRTALISAAVTGKIDVRDWQALASIKTEGAA